MSKFSRIDISIIVVTSTKNITITHTIMQKNVKIKVLKINCFQRDKKDPFIFLYFSKKIIDKVKKIYR